MKKPSIRTILFSVFIVSVIIPSLHADWEENGVPLCTRNGRQRYPRIAPDGGGGAIITWGDDRTAPYDYDVYAQFVDCPRPAKPRGLAGAPIISGDSVTVGLKITWHPDPEQNIMAYAIYRGLSVDFIPAPENRIDDPVPADTVCYDMDWQWMPHYFYKICAMDSSGCESWYLVLTDDSICCGDQICGDDSPGIHGVNHLTRNYPNPFNPSTRITFTIDEPADVSLQIYDVSGRLVRTLVKEKRAAAIRRRHEKRPRRRNKHGEGKKNTGVFQPSPYLCNCRMYV